MTTLHEIPASDLKAGDIGCRVVVIDRAGNAYDGVLTDLGAMAWKYGKTAAEKVRINVTVQSGEKSELKLNALPLDFRVQIEHDTTDAEEARA